MIEVASSIDQPIVGVRVAYRHHEVHRRRAAEGLLQLRRIISVALHQIELQRPLQLGGRVANELHEASVGERGRIVEKQARTAAQLLNRHGQIENFPSNVLGEQRDLALLFKNLATLRTDAPLFKKVETLRWRGATPAFTAWTDRMEAPRLLERCEKAAGR